MKEEEHILNIQERLLRSKQSAFQKYQHLIVGHTSWLFLLKYELIIMFCSRAPGALGLFLRKLFYPRLLGACGRNVVFGANVTLRHPRKIFIGNDVVIDDNCLLDAKGETNTGITVGNGVFIGRNTILHCKNGDIVIGDEVNIGFNCDFASSKRIEVGSKTLIAAYSYLVGGGHAYARPDVKIMDQERVAEGIQVGSGAWIGAGVIVQDGCTIGDDTIVGSGAVVNADLPDHVIAVGLPARVLKHRQ